MKKVAAVIAVAVFVVSVVSMAFAADMKHATVKSVDAKAGTIVYTVEGGADETMKVDKSVDLSSVQAGEKVMLEVENGTVMSVNAARHRAPVGC
jgi:hypothetical protein